MNSRICFGNFRKALFLCFFCLVIINCKAQTLHFNKTQLTIETLDGKNIKIEAEIARTHEQRQQGLMHRDNLADGKGMIFVFEQDQMLSFWMKDTKIPLSIAFISSDGIIIEIRDMQPFDLSPVQSSRSARFALEVPQSWFSRVGISPGDRLLNSRNLLSLNI